MQDFSHCLVEARRKAGLSQEDCAHLLGVSQSHISRLELGRAIPSVSDLCGIAVLFGRSMELMVEPLFRDRAQTIQERLYDLPEPRLGWMSRFARHNALRALEARIDRITTHYDG